jgi:hypothetical protein
MNPPRKNPTDGDKYRQQYINALRLQASNNQLNANANMILKQTGATPTKPTDFRTTTERYADYEGKKILLETQLRELTDGTSASQIAQGLTPEEVVFALNAFPTIKEYFSTKYALGVPAPIAIDYIRRLLAKENITRGVEFGLQQSTGQGILLHADQILYRMPTITQIDELNRLLRNLQDSPALRQVAEDLSILERMLPSANELTRLDRLGADEADDFIRELDELYRGVPTRNDFEGFSSRLEVVRGDPRATERELMSIDAQLRQSPAVARDAMSLREQIRRSTPEPEEDEGSVRSDLTTETTLPAVSSIALTEWTNGSGNSAFNVERKKQILNTWWESNRDAVLTTASGKQLSYGSKLPKAHADLDALHASAVAYQSSSQPAGNAGRGLAKAPRVRKNRLAHLIEGVVEKPKPYVPFGRFVIHRYDLDSGKLNMKTPKGAVIKEIPSQKISQGLAKIFQSLGKGLLPDYDKVNGLKDEDKEVLHKVITHSRMTDKVSVPTPKSKTTEEQMADRFDILKGEIVAGNDNPKIVKEFKVMLMKLINTGRIPRREAHEILTDLASMGV